MSGISLRPIDEHNHPQVRALAVRPDQARFVSSVEKSLADAYVWPATEIRAAYLGEEPVGYVMIYPFQRDGHHIVNVMRLMVDARHQGRGLGRQILRATLAWIASLEPTPDLIRISTVPDNEVALGLYLSMGFTASGMEEGEIALYRRPGPQASTERVS